MLVIDGKPRGQTPATITDLSMGSHTVEVARPGYVPYSARVALSAKQPTQVLTVPLRTGRGDGSTPAAGAATGAAAAATATGSIYVDSRPRGARVMIDGRPVGVTPLRVPELRPGNHDVQLDLEGYRPFTARVALKANEQARGAASLEERNKY